MRQCGEDIFTTMLTAGGNKWGIVCKKVAQRQQKHVGTYHWNEKKCVKSDTKQLSRILYATKSGIAVFTCF